MKSTRRPMARTLPKLPFLSLQMLEGREVPAALVVDPTFDSNTAGWQVTAFNKVSDAFAIATAPDTIDIHGGDYTTIDPATANLTVAAAVTVSGAAQVNAIGATNGTILLNGDLTVGNGASTSIAAVISGGSKFIKTGAGTITLAAANSAYTGEVNVNAGTLAITNAAALGTTAGITVVADGAGLEVSGALTVAEKFTLTGQGVANAGALYHSGGNTAIFSGAITLAGTGARINTTTAGGITTMNGAIGGAGKALTFGGAGNTTFTTAVIGTGVGGTIIKDGAGIVDLGTALHTFAAVDATSVVITVLGGTLAQNGESGAAAGTASNSGPIPAVTVPSYVYLNGGTLRGTRPGAVTWLATPKGITLGPLGGGVETTSTTSTNIYRGRITGVGELRMVGTATTNVLSLVDTSTPPDNDWAGGTRVTGGVLRTRSETGTPTTDMLSTNGALTIEAPGIFDFSQSSHVQNFWGLSGAGTVQQSAVTNPTLVINSPTADTYTFSGTMTGSSRITVAATNKATQIFTGTSTTTGTFTVNGVDSTLLAGNASGNAFGTGALNIFNGSTFGSVSTSTKGVIGNALSIGGATTAGNLAPGNVGTTGRITVNNNVTFTANGTYKVDIRSTALNGFGTTGFDQLVVGSGFTTTITDGAKLLLDLGNYVPTPGDSWKIIDNLNTPGTNNITTRFRDSTGTTVLDQNAEFTLPGGTDLYRINYTGGDGNDVVITRALPASTYFVRHDFNASATDLDSGTPGIQVDGDPLSATEPLATVGVNAFDTISAAVAASTTSQDKIIVNSEPGFGTYAETVNAGIKAILFTFQENPITINAINGSNMQATVTLSVPLTLAGTASPASLAASISGTGGLVKQGTNTVTFNPISNAYTGPTSVEDGVLAAGSSGAFSALSEYTLSATARLVLNGNNASVANLSGPAGSIVENTSATTGAVLTAGDANPLSFAGTLQDGGTASLGFVKVGAGDLTLPTVNTFSGPFGLLGGTYTVDTLNNGGVSGPFGKSSNAATNFRLGGGKLVYTGPAITAATPFDRNITWFNSAGTIDSANDVVFSGSITGNTATPGGFIKNGAGKLTFTALNAFQAVNTATAYGNLSTGTITVNGGALEVKNLTLRGTLASRTGVNYVGTRNLVVTANTSAIIGNTLALDPDAGYVSQVSGSGSLVLDNDSASKTNPTIAFDTGPNVGGFGGGDIRPLGSIIATDTTFSGPEQVVIVGKANRNDLNRHSGDLRFNNKWIGSAPVQFIGLTSTDSSRVNSANASNVHFVLNASNAGSYTGAVSLANADLALAAANSLTVDNSLTFNSVVDANTRNRASLFLFGESFTIGSLNDTSAATTTSDIRNGSIDTATGGTGISSGGALGAQTDSTLTIVQTANGTFGGDFTNGPNDNPEAAQAVYKNLFIFKEGTGKLTLTGTSPVTAPALISNPLAGTITVNAGTLINDGTITTATNVITVGVDGTFGGSGTVKALSVSGHLTAGTSGTAGILKTGNITFPAAATVVADITGTTAGTGYDQIQITGTVDLNNATLSVNNTIAPAPTDGTKFFLVVNDGSDAIANTFQGLAQGDTFIAGSTKFQVYYDADSVSGNLFGGNDFCAVAVPNNSTPVVTGFIVNNAAAQRSRVTNITVQFAGNVSPGSFANAGDIKLTRYAATSQGIVGTIVQTGATGANGLISISQPGPLNELVLTFSNADASNVTSGVEYGSLSDGRWELSIPSASYTSGQVTPDIRRLFGDHDANGTVDASDFSFFPPFGAAIGSEFDFNNNSDIDGGTDFAEFGNRVGVTL